MEKSNCEIRKVNQINIYKLELEINKLRERMDFGDSSEETKNKLNELQKLLNTYSSLTYDMD